MFDPRKMTPGQSLDLYMQYLGLLGFIGDNAPRLIPSNSENEEIIERMFQDCDKLTGIPYKRLINHFELCPDQQKQ